MRTGQNSSEEKQRRGITRETMGKGLKRTDEKGVLD